MAVKPLAGIKILVTRPAHQAQKLCDMITQQGGQAVQLPVIEIVPQWDKTLQQLIQTIDSFDFAVFISPNAVQYGIQAILAQGKIPDKLKLVSIGKASAQKLQLLSNRAADIVPQGQYNSESLLAQSGLQSKAVKNKKIVIFRGAGGRELLATVLQERGAEVTYAEVYRRTIPSCNQNEFRQIWAKLPDIITLTSNEGLSNLLNLCRQNLAKGQLDQLWQTPLLVVTDKMKHNARELGFQADILVAEKSADEAILKALRDYSNNKENMHGKTDVKPTGK